MSKKYLCYGVNDDVDFCEACGKRGLKRVVWLAPLDEEGNELADPAPYGVDCAARMLGWSYSKQKSTAKLEQMNRDRKSAEVEAYIKQLMYGWRICDRKYMLPVDLIERVFRCEITPIEAFTLRNERYPILTYLGGGISLDEAHVMISAA